MGGMIDAVNVERITGARHERTVLLNRNDIYLTTGTSGDGTALAQHATL